MTTTRLASRGRIAVALAGVVTLTATALGQSEDTAAQSTDVAKANSAFSAKSNFWPTPVVPSTGCKPDYALAQDAEISWSSAGTPPNGGAYRYYVTIHRDNNPSEMQAIGFVDGTSTKISRDSSRRDKGWYARVYTVNGPKISTGYRAEGLNITTFALIYSKCSGNRQYVANLPEPDSSTYAPGIAAPTSGFAETDSRVERRLSEPKGPPAETADDGPEGIALNATETAVTVTSFDRPTASTSTRTPLSVPTSASTGTSTSAATGALTTSAQASVATTSAVPTGPALALPGRGEAEIVGGTTLVVSGAAGDVCTVKVRAGSTLKVRSGVLEVTDGVETRVVDQETCELT